jgi:type I restriction-modification system DNA methylase subunit
LEPEHVVALYEAYVGFGDIEGLSKVVATEDIQAQNGNLNITTYVSKIDDEVIPSLKDATIALKASLDEALSAEDDLNRLLIEMGIS